MLSYKFDRIIRLVTIPSRINQNLALLDVDEHLNADCLAVIHDSYVNVIPLIQNSRRAKYVALQQGSHRGLGYVKEVKWLRLKGETLFVIMSTIGVQIYDAEVTEMRFFYSCKERDNEAYAIGACVVQNEFLCVGTNYGVIWMFASNESNTKFALTDVIHVHENEITLLGSFDRYLVTCSHMKTYFWDTKFRNFLSIRKMQLFSLIPTALKVVNGLIFIGYESGEFCIFDIISEHFSVREVAHRLKVTSIDFSPLKFLILTTSMDCFIKIWNFNQANSTVVCCYMLSNGIPIFAGGFLNYSCTEFCIVMEGEVDVSVYVDDVYLKANRGDN